MAACSSSPSNEEQSSMEDNQMPNRSGRDEQMSSSVRNNFQALPNSEDVCTRLIGKIVEKGFSESEQNEHFAPIRPPHPTVIAFPVACHRFHGLDSGTSTNKSDDMNDSGEEDEESEFMAFDQISTFADPVSRKQKTSLDFRRWRELISNDDQVGDDALYSMKSDITSRLDLDGGRDDNTERNDNLVSHIPFPGSEPDNGYAPQAEEDDGTDTNGAIEKKHHLAKKQGEENLMGDSGLLSYGSASGHGTTSLECEIDQENQALLQSMSPEEIAEAQAMIKEKMDPSLQKFLERRGKEKMRRKNLSRSEVDTAGRQSAHASSKKQPIEPANLSPDTSSDNSYLILSNDRKNMFTGGMVQNISSESQKAWNTWCERVEAVRRIRFSLEGTVTEAEIDAGKTSIKKTHVGDEVMERDFLRSEGDPGAVGYTITEAVQLTRSVIPGQRSLALHLLASVLDKAMLNVSNYQVGSTMMNTDKSFDWGAVWAFALGPEPELALTARMCLDDYHSSVVLACAKLMRSIMSCDLNEIFFDISEKTVMYEKYIFTAPIFRNKSEIDDGYLPGGAWKYNAKPSSILTFNEEINGDGIEEEEATIQDDVTVAGQDFTAGLVRMGILHRLHFLLEAHPSLGLEESIITMLIAVVRHSPTCANAVMKCPNLVETVVSRYTRKLRTEMYPVAINSVKLARVLAQSEKKNCATLINDGYFQAMTENLFRYVPSLGEWVKSGMESCRHFSALMVEQLRFWKACIHYGFCISYFTNIFPVLCSWLTAPTLEKLEENNLLREASAVSAEAYLVLEALARTLPTCQGEEMDAWSWSYVSPVVDLALDWLSSINDALASNFSAFHDLSVDSLLRLYLAVLRLISTILERANEEEKSSSRSSVLSMPEIVPKILLEIVGNDSAKCLSLIHNLCNFRQECKSEKSLASACCIESILHVVSSISNMAKDGTRGPLIPADMRFVLDVFQRWMLSEWHVMQSFETFGRGGPSPGVGLGWGASGGGYWSVTAMLIQADARSLILTLKMFDSVSVTGMTSDEEDDDETVLVISKISSVLGACSTLGPRDGLFLEMAFDILFHVPVLKRLAFFIQRFLHRLNSKTKLFLWEYEEDDYVAFSNSLASHFKDRWLSVKRKAKPGDESKSSMAAEWAGQKLPLPLHWFLSPISTVSRKSPLTTHLPSDVAKSGLFFLLGLETMSSFLPSHDHSYSFSSSSSSPVHSVPLVWKLHSLSVTLLVGLDVLEDNKSRAVYEALQEYYGRLVGEATSSRSNSGFLRFRSDVHENYAAFLDVLVGQFAAISYGDLSFGRQISVYLHFETETAVRIAAWNALVNARVLDILPPLENCFVEAERYLEPCEEDEDVLEAYEKAWVSGALDRAKARGTMAFTLVLHHLSSFIFLRRAEDKTVLRNKIVRSLLKAYSQKQQRQEGMMLDLIQYHSNSPSPPRRKEASYCLDAIEIERRLTSLGDACGPNAHRLNQVQKLRSALLNRRH